MKTNLVKCVCMAGALAVGLFAQPARGDTEVEQLKRQFEELKQNFERVTGEQRRTIEELQQRVEKLQAQSESNPPAVAVVPAVAEPAIAAAPAALEKAWSPTDPIRVGSGGTYMDLSMVATFAAGGSTADDIEGGTQLGGHDPNQNGFTVQGVEMNLQGAVDPYFRGNANIAFQIDSGGESFVELEEAWLETVSLPWNLQIRAGQLLTDFGRINTQHPHTWGFVDAPLVSARLLGGDGLRNPGARISWLTPTPFYSELFFSVQNSVGGTAQSFISEAAHEETATTPSGQPFTTTVGRKVNSAAELLYLVRYAASFDLTDNQTVVAGASAAFGPNDAGNDTDTQIYGTDLYWKWKSPTAHAGFPFVSWQTEAMLRRYDGFAPEPISGGASPNSQTYEDWGFYSQVAWGFTKGWVAALRGDYVSPLNYSSVDTIPNTDLERTERWRISPNLTWYPSEFSKIRLQYNYDDREDMGVDHSLWLQFEFLLGAHAAHKF